LKLYGTRFIPNLSVLTDIEKLHPSEPHYYLEFIGTDPAHQGKGLGRVVVTAAMQAATGRYRTVFLLTNDKRTPAIALYLSLGFKPCLNSWDRTQHLRWQRLAAALNRSLPYCRDPRHRDAIANMSR
jgi:GNAT superfamily N-acetyltransferase